jgi:TetR/AcrR family transcriptional regulator, fatty acid metabolism regulator protein
MDYNPTMRTDNSPTVQPPSFIEAARRAQIVKCAIETIAELGYERASLAEIAKRAGVSKSVISYYFAGKDELLDLVVVEVYTACGAFMLPFIQAEKSASGALRAFITSNVEFIGSHRKDIQAVIEIISSSRTADGRPRFDVKGQEQGLADLEEHILRRGQREGEFRKFATSVMAVAIRQSIDALGARLLAYPALDFKEYGEELATIFERATRREDEEAS